LRIINPGALCASAVILLTAETQRTPRVAVFINKLIAES
jgi:hypothetical protein